jgi:hypothetical protein
MVVNRTKVYNWYNYSYTWLCETHEVFKEDQVIPDKFANVTLQNMVMLVLTNKYVRTGSEHAVPGSRVDTIRTLRSTSVVTFENTILGHSSFLTSSSLMLPFKMLPVIFPHIEPLSTLREPIDGTPFKMFVEKRNLSLIKQQCLIFISLGNDMLSKKHLDEKQSLESFLHDNMREYEMHEAAHECLLSKGNHYGYIDMNYNNLVAEAMLQYIGLMTNGMLHIKQQLGINSEFTLAHPPYTDYEVDDEYIDNEVDGVTARDLPEAKPGTYEFFKLSMNNMLESSLMDEELEGVTFKMPDVIEEIEEGDDDWMDMIED